MTCTQRKWPPVLLSTMLVLFCDASNAVPGQELAGCIGEIQRVCATMEDHLETCLAARGSSMTSACREQLTSTIEWMQSPSGPNVCVADIARVCPNATAGALTACIAAKRTELSSACQTYLQSAAQQSAGTTR